MREQKNCARCGETVEIVPAGISKKTGNPYGSFAKCKACNFSEQIGTQPERSNAPQVQPGAANPSFLAGQLTKLADRVARLEDIVLGPPKPEVKVENLPVYEFPIDKVNEDIKVEQIPF